MPRVTIITRRRKGQHTMATPLSRRPEPGDGSPQAAVTISSVTEYLLPATRRGIAAQAMAALGVLTGLWIALSPSFLTLQHGGGNAAVANLIAGLAVAAVGAASLVGPRGYAGLQFASVLLGAWVIISPFILDAKFSIATPMYWSNIVSGGYLMVLALAGLATVRRATR
jgi:SPW repeat